VRADTEDQLRVDDESGGFPVVKLLLAVAVLAGLLLFWYWNNGELPQEPIVAAPIVPAVVPAPEPEPAPDIPAPVEPELSDVDAGSEMDAEPEVPVPAALPSREESDELLRQQLDVAGANAQLTGLVGTEHPLELSAALIDGLSQGMILRKILPANSPKQPFTVTTEGDAFYMDTSSYERYDSYADSISALDTDIVVDSFHLLRPLYERAYEQLGLDSDNFDNSIIRTLDIILATPEIDGPIALESKSVMYTYVDPDLEKLPSLQKQLLRMGPENIRRIKEKARSLRAGLLQQ
jgi:hypothetical protein